MKISEAVWKMAFNLCAGRLHKRFVAGDTVEDAVRKAEELRQGGIYAVINILGEHVGSGQEAEKFLYQYLRLIHLIAYQGLNGTHIAVKPSQLGLEISQGLYYYSLREILYHAKTYLPGSLVEIDREEHRYAKNVKEIALLLARDFPNLRVACQANLNETAQEIREFIKAGISVRLCKGTAYPGDIKEEKKIRKICLEQALLLSEKGNRPAIATHDLYIIDKLREVENLEFQVLLGVENEEMVRVHSLGRGVGFYVPCGPYWRPYGERRGKAIVKIVARNSFYRIGKCFKKMQIWGRR